RRASACKSSSSVRLYSNLTATTQIYPLSLHDALPIFAAEGGLDPRHVAVLYFEDLSKDSSLGYLTDGLTEMLISQLAGVRTLAVTSRNGVAPYRANDLPRDSIARLLRAGPLVEGSVEHVGTRLP